MKDKFDFPRALVLVAFLPGDLDRGEPGPSSVDEIHTDRGQMPVLDREPVGTGYKRAEAR